MNGSIEQPAGRQSSWDDVNRELEESDTQRHAAELAAARRLLSSEDEE